MAQEALAIQTAAARPTPSRTDPSVPQTGPARAPAPAEAPTSEPLGQPKSVTVGAVVEEVNEALALRDIALRFTVDEASDQIVVTVTDEHTGDVIRKIPPDEQLRIAAHLRELLGILVNETV